MPEANSSLMRLVRRPIKIVKNFLKFQITFTLLALLIGFFLPNERFEIPTSAKGLHESDKTLFTKEELAQFNGENGKPIYLALLGSVYDVSKGLKHYGPGCTYNFFVGRDASVAFVTGDFERFDAENADDVIGQLKASDLLSLSNWQQFYDKDYIFKGKLIGRFYDNQGKPTKYYHKYLALVEQAEQAKVQTEQLQILYPDCNLQWSDQKGTRVWCTTSSGGKERVWKGYPRKLFQVGSDKFRCACIKEEDLQTTQIMLKEYDNCDSRSHECFYRVD